MRKLSVIYIILSILFFCVRPKTFVFADTKTTTYAKALVGCNLYKTINMNNSFDDVLFQIPETYFVVVLENVSDSCVKVQYDKYIGYVDSSTIKIATFIPIVKTLSNITFDIKSTSGTQIWSSPTTLSNVYATISAGTKNIHYIAFTYGEIPNGGESNLWFYVSYTPESNSTNVYEGYVYSENVTNLSEIVSNAETNPEIINSDFDLNESFIFVSSTVKTIIISIIAIPIVLFIAIILYKIIGNKQKNTNKDNICITNNENTNDILNQKKIDLNKFKILSFHKNKNTNIPTPSFDGDDDLL